MDLSAKRTLPYAVPLGVGLLVLLGAWFAGRAANPGPLGLRLDDAWIHLVYGRELARSGLLAYNTGIPSTGCTSPLWAACLAVLHGIAGRGPVGGIIRAAILSGALLHLATVIAGVAVALRITGNRLAAAGAGCLIALATPLALASFSGMEVTLTGLLLLIAVHALLARRLKGAGITLALSGLARPEAAAVTVALAATRSVRARTEAGSHHAPSRIWLYLGVPSVVAGLAVAAHHLWAGGAPLPATFYAKSSVDLAEMPFRIATAFRWMLSATPPFGWGLGWLALVGLVPWGGRRPSLPDAYLPVLAGFAYLLANLTVVRPDDPQTFYHLRYVLPAVPSLLVAVAVGAHEIGLRLPSRAAAVPLAVLLALSAVGFAGTAGRQSRHFHNDVRNINEVQRRIGRWLGSQPIASDTWIAASDAGAVRYLSGQPTLDVNGLNTPEMLDPEEEFVASHPVAAVVLMPALFRPLDEDDLEIVFKASTARYTVTSNPEMAGQVVARARSGQSWSRLRARFVGLRSFELEMLVPRRASPAAPPDEETEGSTLDTAPAGRVLETTPAPERRVTDRDSTP